MEALEGGDGDEAVSSPGVGTGSGDLSRRRKRPPADSSSSTTSSASAYYAAAPCQPDAASINTHLLFVDVKTATIAASPMIYPVPLVAGDNRTAQVFGIAARGA